MGDITSLRLQSKQVTAGLQIQVVSTPSLCVTIVSPIQNLDTRVSKVMMGYVLVS